MLDLLLTNHLLKAVRPGTHVLFVGDMDQLPSVGAGDVLRNLIHSGIAPITRLNTIFRQAADSKIITNAHLINQGKFPVFSQGSGDFFFFPAEDARKPQTGSSRSSRKGSRRNLASMPVHDIQVLAPIYRGPAGVIALNDRLQEKLNPATKATNRNAGCLERPSVWATRSCRPRTTMTRMSTTGILVSFRRWT